MAANAPTGPIQQIGTDAAPISIPGGGIVVWTHNMGQKAKAIWAVRPTDRSLIHVPNTVGPGSTPSIAIAQPSVNAIQLTSMYLLGVMNCILFVEWEIPSADEGAALSQSVFV